jgi:cation diffusion facilitator CzcD-associated flavoprotein CzcO
VAEDGGRGRDIAIRRAAIVGAGPSGLIAFAALRYRGLAPDEVAVYDDRPPLSVWTERTDAILQAEMRSESDGHLFPTDFPGFALLDSARTRSLRPLLRSAINRYHPSRLDIQRHGLAVASHYHLEHCLCAARVDRITFGADPEPHVRLHDASGDVVGRARNVLLGLGHGALRWPEALADEGFREPFGACVSHAYQRKTYGPRTYLVIGSGMAAAAEWTNILRADGRVVALRRKPDLLEQPLSAPRCYFSGPLLDGFHQLERAERADVLRNSARGSYPASDARDRLLVTAMADGRMQHRVGTLAGLAHCGGRLVAMTAGSGGVEEIVIDEVIAATGFESGWTAHPILRALVTSLDVDTEGEFIVLNSDCTIPLQGVQGATVSVAGPLARWVFPPADSFAGMKYVARRFANTVFEARAGLAPGPLAWWRLVRAGAPPRVSKVERLPCVSL